MEIQTKTRRWPLLDRIRPHAISAISRPHPRIVGPTPLYTPGAFYREGCRTSGAPLINGEARHTRSRTTRGGGRDSRVRTDIVSRWRIIWRSVSRRFLGGGEGWHTGDKRGVVTDLPKGCCTLVPEIWRCFREMRQVSWSLCQSSTRLLVRSMWYNFLNWLDSIWKCLDEEWNKTNDRLITKVSENVFEIIKRKR